MNYDEITSRLARGGELIWVPYVSSSMKVKPLDTPMLLTLTTSQIFMEDHFFIRLLKF
jgi:hypothetical protein